MPHEWFVQKSGEEIGPISVLELQQMGESGAIAADSLVRLGRDGKWVPAIKVKGLSLRSPNTADDAPHSDSPSNKKATAGSKSRGSSVTSTTHPADEAAPASDASPDEDSTGAAEKQPSTESASSSDVDDDLIASWLGPADGKGAKRPTIPLPEPVEAEPAPAPVVRHTKGFPAGPRSSPPPAPVASKTPKESPAQVSERLLADPRSHQPRAKEEKPEEGLKKDLKTLLLDRRLHQAAGLMAFGIACVFVSDYYFNRRASPEHDLEVAFKKNPAIVRRAVAPFAGRVTIDGQPPGETSPPTSVIVTLHPKQPESAKAPLAFTTCDAQGNFSFSTYGNGDGAPTGPYTLTFARLARLGGHGGFGPPDQLKNLYNDPEKNSKLPDFSIDISSPGKTNYHKDLPVAAKTPITAPGPHAVTRVGAAPNQ
jgi:hypothetical protein